MWVVDAGQVKACVVVQRALGQSLPPELGQPGWPLAHLGGSQLPACTSVCGGWTACDAAEAAEGVLLDRPVLHDEAYPLTGTGRSNMRVQRPKRRCKKIYHLATHQHSSSVAVCGRQRMRWCLERTVSACKSVPLSWSSSARRTQVTHALA